MRKESVRVEKDILIREDGILLTCPTIRAKTDATLYCLKPPKTPISSPYKNLVK